jgi:hypothetical protein
MAKLTRKSIAENTSHPFHGRATYREKLRIISTPNGLSDKFTDLWLNNLNPNFDLNLHLNANPSPAANLRAV